MAPLLLRGDRIPSVVIVLLLVAAAAGGCGSSGTTTQGAAAIPHRGANLSDVLFHSAEVVLAEDQGIELGRAISEDDQTVASLSHFKLYARGECPISSVEVQRRSGDIYIAYAPCSSPIWYDTRYASDDDDYRWQSMETGVNGSHPFTQLVGANFETVRGCCLPDVPQVPINWIPPDRAQLYLRLGYEDESFPSGNGYADHDDGTDDQCKGVPDAFVEVTIDHDPQSPWPVVGTAPPPDQWNPPTTTRGDERITLLPGNANTTRWRIDHPNITTGRTDYPAIRFRIGDRIILKAGGCAQTGGHGDTWKRYVDPSGPDADKLYHGLVWIPGVTPGYDRINNLLGRMLTIPTQVSQAFLSNQGPAPRWLVIPRDTPLPHETPPSPYSADYCGRDWVNHGGLNIHFNRPEWQTILPVNIENDQVFIDNGQRTLIPAQPASAPGNHYVTWRELLEITQSDPAQAQDILAWRGEPNLSGDEGHPPVPWISSTMTGIVTNSFLSGADYGGDHRESPTAGANEDLSKYWLGSPPPFFRDNCSVFTATQALCDDWVVQVLPDPEYHFMRMLDWEHEQGSRRGWGNFEGGLQGNVENEIEQWMIPEGFRPQPGDRIWMSGRWVVDCAHEDFHGELHPIEAFATSHAEPAAASSFVLDNTLTVSTVVVTADWQGGTLEFDVWPPVRPSPGAVLGWERKDVAITGLSVTERLDPADNPNHVHVVVTAPETRFTTGGWNDIKDPNLWRRFLAKYRAWWCCKPLTDRVRRD